MLSGNMIRKSRVYAICERSGDVQVGSVFSFVVIAAPNSFRSLPDTAVVCCGRDSSGWPLFRTVDGRYYFSLTGGYGEEDGILYGLDVGLYYDFGHPTDEANILEECAAQVGTYHSFCGALAYGDRKRKLDRIAAVMREKVMQQ